jgi:hypothetical protein
VAYNDINLDNKPVPFVETGSLCFAGSMFDGLIADRY